jgi:hypothetical protein
MRQRLADKAASSGVSMTARAVLNALATRAALMPDRRESRRGTIVQRHWVRPDGFNVLRVWPGERWLAEKVGRNERTIRRAIKDLVTAGLIERKARAGGAPGRRNGANLPTETLLLVPPKDQMPKAPLRYHGSPAGFDTSPPQSTQPAGTLLTGLDGENAPKAAGGMDLRQNGEDIPDRTVRTKLSSPLITVRGTQENQTNVTASIDAKPQPVSAGLDCFARQSAEPAEPSDPACPVETVETAEADRDEHGWGENGPELSDLRPWMVEKAIAAYPNLAPYKNEPKTMLDGFRKASGYPPGSTNRNIKQMVGIGMRHKDAQKIAREWETQPDRLRDTIAAVREETRGGGIENPAGLLCHRVKEMKARRSGG